MADFQRILILLIWSYLFSGLEFGRPNHTILETRRISSCADPITNCNVSSFTTPKKLFKKFSNDYSTRNVVENYSTGRVTTAPGFPSSTPRITRSNINWLAKTTAKTCDKYPSEIPSMWNTRALYKPGFRKIGTICQDNGSNLDILLFVISPFENFKARAAFRSTWKKFISLHPNTKLLYLVDTPPTPNAKLDTELSDFDDIVQASNQNGRYDQSLMVEAMLEWTDIYCNRVKFVARIDDHTFVNVPKLLSLVQAHKEDAKTILGTSQKFSTNDSSVEDSYNIVKCLYPDLDLSDHLSKALYIIPHHVVKYLHSYSMASLHLPSDDVYFTGVIANETNVKKKSIPNRVVDFHAVNATQFKNYAGIITNDRNIFFEQDFIRRVLLNQTQFQA